MISFIRYDKGLGDNSIYSRIRNSINEFWNFETLIWNNTELSGCKVFLTELPDIDSYDSLYLEDLILPTGGPYIQEAMLNGINLAYDSTAVDTDTDALIQSIYDNMSKEATLLSLSGNVDSKFSSTLSDLSYIKNKVDDILNNVNGLSGDEATEIYLLNNILSDILILSGNILSVKSKTDTINWNNIDSLSGISSNIYNEMAKQNTLLSLSGAIQNMYVDLITILNNTTDIKSKADNITSKLLSLSGNIEIDFDSVFSDLSSIDGKSNTILSNLNILSGNIFSIQTSVNNIPTTPLLSGDSRLNNLDAKISAMLPLSAYVLPDNSSISAIKSKTDAINWNDVIDLKDEALGKWILNHNANPKTLTLYRLDGVTILKTFTLGMTIDDIPPFISRE